MSVTNLDGELVDRIAIQWMVARQTKERTQSGRRQRFLLHQEMAAGLTSPGISQRIVAKKLKYRGSRLLPRDIFDLLTVQRFDPMHIGTAVRTVPDGARRAADRIERIATRYRQTIGDEVNPTSTGVELLDVDPLDAARALLTGRVALDARSVPR